MCPPSLKRKTWGRLRGGGKKGELGDARGDAAAGANWWAKLFTGGPQQGKLKKKGVDVEGGRIYSWNMDQRGDRLGSRSTPETSEKTGLHQKNRGGTKAKAKKTDVRGGGLK